MVPQIRFVESAPVYFDRHTLTLKPGLLSLFSMEGRLRFQLQLDQPFTERFARLRLREVMLLCREGQFGLQFSFLEEGETEVRESAEDLPEYLLVLDPQLQPGAAAIEAVVNMSPSGI